MNEKVLEAGSMPLDRALADIRSLTWLNRIAAWWNRSIRWKLVGVFMTLNVIPMLIATNMATQVISDAFQDDVKAWLYQTSRFFVTDVLDERQETARVADALIGQSSFAPILDGASQNLPTNVTKIIDALGYDLLMICDDTGRVIFSSKTFESLIEVPFGDNQSVYLYRADGRSLLMAAGTRVLEFQNRIYRILLGTWIDQSFISNISSIESLEIRLSYKVDGKFVQVYSSHQTSENAVPIPPHIITALEFMGLGQHYLTADAADDNSFIGIYVPLSSNGQLVGIVFCGLSTGAGMAYWLTSTNLFIGIFVVGMGLSVTAGLILSRLLTQPVIRLAEGVNAIAKGDFSQRVPVRQHDEIGQLAFAFNLMARQLEDLRKMESKLRRRERLTMLGKVAAGLAHEIRNPLGIIKTSAELLQQNPKLNEVESRRLGYVIDEVRRIDKLIRNFLAFARPPQRMEDVHPGELIERVLGFCHAEIAKSRVEVVVINDAPEALVRIDPDQLTQACLNLLLNALESMDATCQLAEKKTAQGKKLTIHIALKDDGLHLQFSDTGCGIPAELIDRIFDPFVTTKATGTGLGLAEVFAVAESHGGWIDVRNETDGGASFDLVLSPLERGE
jgi:signal transduction histidine kinase